MLNEIFITTRQSALYSSISVDNRKLGLKDLSRKWKHFRLGKEKCFFQIFNIKDKKMNVYIYIYIYIYIYVHIYIHTHFKDIHYSKIHIKHTKIHSSLKTLSMCVYMYIYIFFYLFIISAPQHAPLQYVILHAIVVFHSCW